MSLTHRSEGSPRLAVQGERNGRAKLTEDLVREARRLRAKGWTLRELGALLEVSTSTAGYAVRGQTWGHIA